MAQTGIHFQPPAALSEVIKHFYYIRTPADFERTVQHLAPNFEVMIVFNFGVPLRLSFAQAPVGQFTLEQTGLLGPLRKMLNYEVLPDTDLLIAVFHLNGFYRLFQQPVDHLDDSVLNDPDILLPEACCHQLWQVMRKSSSPEERVQMAHDYIGSFVQGPDTNNLSLQDVVHYFQDSTVAPVKALAADAGTSERTIQLRFKKYVGYSPKELLRFLRFKEVIQHLLQLSPAQDVDWFEYIHEFGYHDQSHLIKDFKQYLGTTPQQFIKKLREQGFCVTRPGSHYS
ncbi:helix-turn-helix domain-containing protein [Chitinophaga pendula]|uniref:helix-turn-helix domain-containing protein n=1 Tax=Chitinophaga TaxID=79328 RepID=UPI000BAF8D2C|nr:MULTISPECIES: helix-turn-helix domain-containing protein [Chitinophaga]ASZ12300.1 hypothetical protein CK934_15690 [Chitinophaga sp. MD30]UCJ10111.1 helix-turn-helix domain-containing protein [Chitinophaga pendula]